MRMLWLVSALILLLTAPYWLGFLAGLWHQRVYAGIVRRRGLWMVLQWPLRQVWRSHRWVFHWCPPICGVLIAVYLVCGVWLAFELLF
jgi:hypothetical protein